MPSHTVVYFSVQYTMHIVGPYCPYIEPSLNTVAGLGFAKVALLLNCTNVTSHAHYLALTTPISKTKKTATGLLLCLRVVHQSISIHSVTSYVS